MNSRRELHTFTDPCFECEDDAHIRPDDCSDCECCGDVADVYIPTTPKAYESWLKARGYVAPANGGRWVYVGNPDELNRLGGFDKD